MGVKWIVLQLPKAVGGMAWFCGCCFVGSTCVERCGDGI